MNAEDSSIIRADPTYNVAYVYGNVILEHPNSGNNDIVLYGGDTGAANKYRKGTLYFFNNTVYSDRTDATRLFRVSTNDQSVDARNNLVWVTAAASNLQVLDNYGQLTPALNPAVLPAHNVVREYVTHQSSVARAVHGPFDIGAYEF